MGVPGRMSRGKTDMQHLLISIRLPEGHWAGDITRERHSVLLRVDEHMALPGGRGLSSVVATSNSSVSNIDEFLEYLQEHSSIEEITVFDKHDDSLDLSLTIARKGGGFLKPLLKAKVTPQTPFTVRDGWVEWEFVTDHNHVKELVKALKKSGLPHRIHSLSKEAESRLLTIRQREIFDLAVSSGYYETPRRITLTGLAESAGVSKSTLCEMIHLIEKHIIDEFADSVRRQSPKD
ncbi:MAG: helix-turn-helix domain-containing protein [Candidatus Thalassarchaeaceae archaeon]|nr:helix-turn-helix domain-containing protein [Candidatus Thalassarchaeaceae archaeon]